MIGVTFVGFRITPCPAPAARVGACLLTGLLASCSDPAAPPSPSAMTPAGSIPDIATVATGVSPRVVVTDAAGRPVPGVDVQFGIQGGGAITTASALTDASGIASPGTWTLGTSVGTNTLTARAGSLPTVTFTVDARADIPAEIRGLTENVTSGTAGLALETAPGVQVRDRFGNPVADVDVSFTPGLTSGSVVGSRQRTDSDGMARPGIWRLGNRPGEHTLTAVAGSVSTEIVVAAVAGAPAAVYVLDGDAQHARVGTALPQSPQVRVTDEFNNGLQGVPVEFVVSSGGGEASGRMQVTDAEGRARVGGWVLGSAAGEQILTARVSASVAVGIRTGSS